MNVFDFAMKMELDGKMFYENLAAGTSLAGLKAIFTMLAKDEQKHHDIIRAMRDKTGHTAMADSTALENARNIFNGLIIDRETLNTKSEDIDGYTLAMKIESDSIRFYEDVAAKEKDDRAREIFCKIASEEKKHYEIVENIYEFVLRPKYFLAWGEFSNLQEL